MLKKQEKKQKSETLSDIIERIIRKNGGIAHLSLIYKEVEAIRPRVSKATIRAIIRDACKETLRRPTDKPRFVRIGKGVYGIYGYNNPIK
jgi:hypothetical protein